VVLILIGLLIASGYSTLLASSRLAGIMPNLEGLLSIKTAPPVAPPANTTFPPAPDVEFQALDGQAVRLTSLRGRVVLLNFWATWCIPCRSEIPEFNALQRDLQAKGLSVVGVSVSPVDTADSIRSFQKDVRQDYTVWRGAEEIGSQFGNGPGLPVTYVLDRAGRIRQKFIGPQSRENFEAAIKPVLDEAPVTAQTSN
jgi:peroxiredoxin